MPECVCCHIETFKVKSSLTLRTKVNQVLKHNLVSRIYICRLFIKNKIYEFICIEFKKELYEIIKNFAVDF